MEGRILGVEKIFHHSSSCGLYLKKKTFSSFIFDGNVRRRGTVYVFCAVAYLQGVIFKTVPLLLETYLVILQKGLPYRIYC